MSRNNNGFNSYAYIPLILTFAFLLGCFAVALSTMREDVPDDYTVADVSAFDLRDESNTYEMQEKDGVKYYVLSTPNDDTAVSSNITPSTTTTSTEDFGTTISAQKDRVAYLTFDDGPSKNTLEILNILDKYNVKATFFVIYHKGMEKEYKEIVKRGHTIALHSYTHNYKKIYSSEDAYFKDLEKIGNYVKSVTGVETNIIRFPGGSSNTISNKYSKGIMKTLKQEVLEKEYVYHDWNVDSTDASGNNVPVETLLENVKKSLPKYRRANILMHDTGKAKQTTVEALPQIIEYVQSQGYNIEPITDDTVPIKHNW